MRRASVLSLAPIRQDERLRCVCGAARRGAPQASAKRDRPARFPRMSGADAPVQSVSPGVRIQRLRGRRGRPEPPWMSRCAAVASVRQGRMLSAIGGPVRQARQGHVRGQKAEIVQGRRINVAGLRSAEKSLLRTLRRVRLRLSPGRLKSALSDEQRVSGLRVPPRRRVKKLFRNVRRPRTLAFGWPN